MPAKGIDFLIGILSFVVALCVWGEAGPVWLRVMLAVLMVCAITTYYWIQLRRRSVASNGHARNIIMDWPFFPAIPALCMLFVGRYAETGHALWMWSLAASLGISMVVYVIIADQEPSDIKPPLLYEVFGMTAAIFILAMPYFRVINFDSQAQVPGIVSARVVGKSHSRGRGAQYRLRFGDAPLARGVNYLIVSEPDYRATTIGDDVCLGFYPGALGVPWYAKVPCP